MCSWLGHSTFAFLIVSTFDIYLPTWLQMTDFFYKLPFTPLDHLYTVFQKNPCDYVFDDNLNSKRPILLIFGTVIT